MRSQLTEILIENVLRHLRTFTATSLTRYHRHRRFIDDLEDVVFHRPGRQVSPRFHNVLIVLIIFLVAMATADVEIIAEHLLDGHGLSVAAAGVACKCIIEMLYMK